MSIEIWADTDPLDMQAIMQEYRGALAFDVGGNAGQSATRFAQTFGRVISFEPAFESFDYLARNAPPNVLPLQVAVSDHDGDVTLVEYERHMAQGQLASDGQSQWLDNTVGAWGQVIGHRTVPCVTLDTFCRLTQLVPDLIKVDTEGHEVSVILGAMGLIGDVKPDLYIEVHGAQLGARLGELLTPIYGDRLEKMLHSHYGPDAPEALEHWWYVVR